MGGARSTRCGQLSKSSDRALQRPPRGANRPRSSCSSRLKPQSMCTWVASLRDRRSSDPIASCTCRRRLQFWRAGRVTTSKIDHGRSDAKTWCGLLRVERRNARPRCLLACIRKAALGASCFHSESDRPESGPYMRRVVRFSDSAHLGEPRAVRAGLSADGRADPRTPMPR